MSRNNSFKEEQLTDAAYYILLSLLNPIHGYGIMQYVDELTQGEFIIGPATLYTILKKMLDAEYITLNGEDEDRRKTYCITEIGKAVILREVERRAKMAEHGKQAIDALKEVKK